MRTRVILMPVQLYTRVRYATTSFFAIVRWGVCCSGVSDVVYSHRFVLLCFLFTCLHLLSLATQTPLQYHLPFVKSGLNSYCASTAHLHETSSSLAPFSNKAHCDFLPKPLGYTRFRPFRFLLPAFKSLSRYFFETTTGVDSLLSISMFFAMFLNRFRFRSSPIFCAFPPAVFVCSACTDLGIPCRIGGLRVLGRWPR